MKKYFIILILCLSVNLSAKNLATKVQSIEKEIETLNIKNDSLEKILIEYGRIIEFNKRLIDSQSNLIGNSNDSISNQISSTSNFISIAGLVLGFFGLFIGGYVTWMQNRSAKILKKSKEIQDEVNKTKSEIETTQNLIENDIKGLYSKIQEEEVNYMLNRLEKIPEDIQHVFPILASMDISNKFFDRIKPIIINEKSKQEPTVDFAENLITLSCQHFPELVVKDSEMLGLLLDNEENLFNDFYDIELQEFIVVLFNHIQNIGLYNSAENIKKFLLLTNSMDAIPLFVETIFSSLNSKLNRFEFGRIVKDVPNIQNIKNEFYKNLIKNYNNDDNTENDNLLLAEIQK